MIYNVTWNTVREKVVVLGDRKKKKKKDGWEEESKSCAS